MSLREQCLPQGWYPRDGGTIQAFLEPFGKGAVNEDAVAAEAVIAPHAGWYYSGLTAAMAVSALAGGRPVETVAVIGGHLPGGMPVLAAMEDEVKTPLGNMTIDRELRESFAGKIAVRPDRYNDNTVEVLLPMVRWFFPGAALFWLRFPADISSFGAGKILAETAGELGRNVAVVASTDLTHYGENYGFSPRGGGRAALEWVKTVNDAAFITAVLKGEASELLRRSEEDFSACSAGAVLGALGFVSSPGKVSGRLLDYRTSADRELERTEAPVPDSFVGYAAISLARA